MRTLADLAARLTPATVQRATALTANQAGSLMVARTRMRMSGRVLNRRSGRLLRSVRYDVKAQGMLTTLSVSAGAPGVHIKPHEFGATIRPKRAQFLTFKIGNRWIRARKVTIPKRPTIGPSVREGMDAIPAMHAQNFRRLLRGA